MSESHTQKLRRHSVEVLTVDHEMLLWKRGILNLTDAVGMSRAAYFYFCKAFGVYSRHAIRDVIREQFRLGEDDIGKYVEFVDFEKMDRDDAGSTAMQPTRRVVHYDDPANNYSVYKILATYMTHIPASGEFFRKPIMTTMQCQKPVIQFASRPIGINLLSHYLSDMMKAAGFFKEHFTTQSIKTAVVSILFRVGIDEDITRQRTRWWGPSGRVGSISHTLTSPGPSSSVRGMSIGMQSEREKLVTISRLLDPPHFTLIQPTQEAVSPIVVEVQHVTSISERPPSSDDVTPHTLSISRSEMTTSSIQALPQLPQLENRPSHHRQEVTQQGEPYKWFSEESSYGVESASDTEEEHYLSKRPRFVSTPKSPDRQSTSQQDFVAVSGPVLDSSVIPKHITRSPMIKVEPDDDDDDCVVVSSITDNRSYDRHEQQACGATSTKRSATSSTSSSRQDSYNHDKSRPEVKNPMQCLTNSEMKEATTRPPREGTSALSLAFKFAYEIDHNGEVAASREVRALHTTNNNDTSSVKRRLLPMNVVDSSGLEATERQEELPNFSINLSDFFPSISQQNIDIKDVVIRGTRGQGTDRLNVELVVAERSGGEQEVQHSEHFDF